MFLSASVVVVFFFGGEGVGEYPISSILETHLSSLLSRYLKFNRVGIIEWWNGRMAEYPKMRNALCETRVSQKWNRKEIVKIKKVLFNDH